jgi:hypothetical protein
LSQSAGERTEDPRVASALARNDRYVREFVEAFNLCPYARRTRESGLLKKVVLLEQNYDEASAALGVAIERLECLPADSIDVGLIIFPALAPELSQGLDGAHAFERLVGEARERMQARHKNGDTPFYCVPFHPDFAEDLTDEHRAVRFIRRSPDPTVQLVRASVLRAVRGSGATDYVNTSGLNAAELMAISVPLPVSDRISQANLRTLHEQSPDRMRGLLSDLRLRSPLLD